MKSKKPNWLRNDFGYRRRNEEGNDYGGRGSGDTIAKRLNEEDNVSQIIE